MNVTARVANVTRTHLYDDDLTPIDVVTLHWDGKAYLHQTEPGRYCEGDEVPITPPTSGAGNVTLDR